MTRVTIIGGGFAGLNAAITLGNKKGIEVTLLDRRNHHIFQPLLYQVAMAALSPADIAAPIRSILSKYRNIRVLNNEVTAIDAENKQITCASGQTNTYDYLIVASGAKHHYFGNEQWEQDAPGLKTMAQATEIRRRVLNAFELAEREFDKTKKKRLLTFVIVGAGATGVELAGALGEMSRFTLAKDFHNIDPKKTRIMLIEGSDRILNGFDDKLAAAATRSLEQLGVQVWTNSIVTAVDKHGIEIGEERIETETVLWAAGVKASELAETIDCERDNSERIIVSPDLSIPAHPDVFVTGDMAHFAHTPNEQALPGLAPVALQQGVRAAKNILADLKEKPRKDFKYYDKGTMATIGRNKAIAETMGMKMHGYFAWLAWLFVHIYYLIGFKSRVIVLLNWVWSYLTFDRGSRLIVSREWRFYGVSKHADSPDHSKDSDDKEQS